MTIQELVIKIKVLENELALELQKKQEEFYYTIKGKKIYFEESIRRQHRALVINIRLYILNASILSILTAPIIWSCIIPALIMDIFVTSYQALCFRVYGIPRVDRDDYIIIDHNKLAYLNIIEKVNCMYCSYFNGLMGYVSEIAARSEQYWCPIKHARKVAFIHSRYKHFLEYGDALAYKEKLSDIRKDFDDLERSSQERP